MTDREQGEERLPAFESGTDEPDFADEHSDMTVAEELPGGPEHAKPDDAPSGIGGMDVDDGKE
ncbi:MAG TPA: hypothetical protein VF054_18685 [Micromonosporaceae bacterium]